MAQARKFLVAGGTFSAALAIGFVMQNDLVSASSSQPVAMPVEAVAEVGASGPVIAPAVIDAADVNVALPATLDPIEEMAAPVLVAAVIPEDITGLSDAEDVTSMECMPEMFAMAKPMAMVELDLLAPCDPNARLTIHHQGMVITTTTDAGGNLTIELPALSENALFLAAFDNDNGAVAQVDVPDLAAYDRSVLQWEGAAGVSIHAFERGAAFGEAGHVWPEAMTAGAGQFLLLGDADQFEPKLAQVYTYPKDALDASGVALDVEVAITEANCGREISAQSIQLRGTEAADAVDLTMVMPDCEAAGDFLLLKNMFEDLTLAAK